jgi:hypothetical protein
MREYVLLQRRFSRNFLGKGFRFSCLFQEKHAVHHHRVSAVSHIQGGTWPCVRARLLECDAYDVRVICVEVSLVEKVGGETGSAAPLAPRHRCELWQDTSVRRGLFGSRYAYDAVASVPVFPREKRGVFDQARRLRKPILCKVGILPRSSVCPTLGKPFLSLRFELLALNLVRSPVQSLAPGSRAISCNLATWKKESAASEEGRRTGASEGNGTK